MYRMNVAPPQPSTAPPLNATRQQSDANHISNVPGGTDNGPQPMLGLKTSNLPDGKETDAGKDGAASTTAGSNVDGSTGAGQVGGEWDEERIVDSLRKLEEMHSKLNHLRSTIPRMIQPLTADYASPEELFNDFSSRAVAASEEVLQFTQLYTANRYLMEHASQSRAASREGIRRWGLKDGMPEGVLIVNEQEREDAKEREERQKQVQKEALERKRRRSAAAGEEMVIDEGPKEGDNGEAELEDEDAKRDEEERKEEGREPREVVEEFKGKLERGEGVEEAWKRVKMEYVHSVGGGVGDLASSGVGGGGQGGELAGGNNTLKLASVVAHIKVTLPPPVNLLFTIAVSPKDTTGGSSSNASGPGYRYTILSLVSATQPDAPITPHLYTGVIRAVAGRPQPGNLRLLLEMLCCYVGVYNERCKKCGRLTFSGGAATVGVGGGGKAELPVVRRRGKVPVPVGAGEKAREKGKPKTELKWEPWHEGCLEERTGTGSGVGN